MQQMPNVIHGDDRSTALKLTPVSRETVARLERFLDLLVQWQVKTNLVAPSTLSHLWTRHVSDSLQLLAIAPAAKVWADLGSGGGFPGIVLACALADAPDDGVLRVLLVEEPEAHLHPQLQDLLMRFLEEEAEGSTQVIVTSHSPGFASSARVERLTVIARPSGAARPVARVPRDFGLSAKQLGHLRRFLDVTKASLFFARAVILVEGVSEQLLLPAVARRLEISLPENGSASSMSAAWPFPRLPICSARRSSRTGWR